MADKEILLNEDEIIVLADYLAQVPISQTVDKINKSKATINRYRKKIKPFLEDTIDLEKMAKRVVGFYPLVLESLAFHLKNKDKEVTFKIAQRLGLLGSDGGNLTELLGAIKNSGDKTTINNFFGNMPKSDVNKLRDNIKAAYRF